MDKQKKILLRSIKSRGAEHESTEFKLTSLYKWMLINWRQTASKGLHFIGDSAYFIKLLVLTPYDNTANGTPEDNCNFFHSSSRIAVECCFGEVDLQFSIFWRPLKFFLMTNGLIIDACLWLHNIILENSNRSFMDSVDKEVFDEDCRHYFSIHLDIPEGVDGGELGIQRSGCPCRLEATSATVDKNWRDLICDEIAKQGLSHPSTNWYRDNNQLFQLN